VAAFGSSHIYSYRSWWPRGLRRGCAAARLLGLWVRIPPGAWMSLCRECCVLSSRGLCDELITRPTDCGVSNECDRKTPYAEAMNRKRVERPHEEGRNAHI
jgi:hypothetical protein